MRELSEDEIKAVVGGPQNKSKNPEFPLLQNQAD